MVMIGLLFASLFMIAPVNKAKSVAEDYKSALITEVNSRGNYTLIGVDDSSLGSEFRLYHYDDLLIDEVSDSDFISKLSRFGLKKERVILLTDKNIYYLKSKSPTFVITYPQLIGITLSKTTFIFSYKSLHFVSKSSREI